jgi:hypothetical protein
VSGVSGQALFVIPYAKFRDLARYVLNQIESIGKADKDKPMRALRVNAWSL